MTPRNPLYRRNENERSIALTLALSGPNWHIFERIRDATLCDRPYARISTAAANRLYYNNVDDVALFEAAYGDLEDALAVVKP